MQRCVLFLLLVAIPVSEQTLFYAFTSANVFFCRPHVDVKRLCRNTKVVAEALARVIYNLTEKVPTLSEPHTCWWVLLKSYIDVVVLLKQGAPGDLQIFTEQMVNVYSVSETGSPHPKSGCISEEEQDFLFVKTDWYKWKKLSFQGGVCLVIELWNACRCMNHFSSRVPWHLPDGQLTNDFFFHSWK